MNGKNGFQAITFRWLTNVARVSVGTSPLAGGAAYKRTACLQCLRTPMSAPSHLPECLTVAWAVRFLRLLYALWRPVGGLTA